MTTLSNQRLKWRLFEFKARARASTRYTPLPPPFLPPPFPNFSFLAPPLLELLSFPSSTSPPPCTSALPPHCGQITSLDSVDYENVESTHTFSAANVRGWTTRQFQRFHCTHSPTNQNHKCVPPTPPLIRPGLFFFLDFLRRNKVLSLTQTLSL